jgi:murein DD-endopeptidase MepM/ murein hydrolase activator NlpD
MRSRLHPVLLVCSLAACVGLCACAAEVEEAATIVDRSDVNLPRDGRVVSARVPRGATLAAVLRGHDLAEIDVAAIVARVASVFDPRLFRVDRPYRLDQRSNGELRRFEYEIDGDRVLRVQKVEESDASFLAEIVPIAKTSRQAVVRGEIDRAAPSLFSSVDRAGEEIQLAVDMAAVFAGEVDFNTELQPGDRFDLLLEKRYRQEDHAFGGYGPILAATLENDGRRLRAIRFALDGAPAGYFDENGASLRRFFLRSPLKFEPVVTSHFSRSRLHPVLHVRRAHLGVDYRAPTGAPVVAVADGVVVRAGWSGGSGRMVHLRHASGFESQYLHLSAITVRAGARVRQGDLIGRVGSTGLASGPHLDYRLRKNGTYINPVTAHRAMPPGEPVPAGQRAAFDAVRDRALAALAPEPIETTGAQFQ